MNEGLRDWGRAFGGSLIFALPMLMTMEMWQLGFHAEPLRLVVLLVVSLPLLMATAYFSGFERTESMTEVMFETFAAIFVGALVAVIILLLFGILNHDMSLHEIIGKIVLQTLAGSLGALLARSQFGEEPAGTQARPTYLGVLVLMVIGALYFGLNVAPTEEMVLISYNTGPRQELLLALLSLAIMHAFVYAVGFPGQPNRLGGAGSFTLFMVYTVPGYALVLGTSMFLLWTFGRTQGTGVEEIVSACVVLGFPCAIGAAASRVIL